MKKNKPSLKAYYKTRFKRYSHIIKCDKTDVVYLERKYILHEIVVRVGLVLISLVLSIILINRIIIYDNLSFPYLYVGLYILIILAWVLLSPIIVYHISKFDIIDESELNQNPKIKKALSKR